MFIIFTQRALGLQWKKTSLIILRQVSVSNLPTHTYIHLISLLFWHKLLFYLIHQDVTWNWFQDFKMKFIHKYRKLFVNSRTGLLKIYFVIIWVISLIGDLGWTKFHLKWHNPLFCISLNQNKMEKLELTNMLNLDQIKTQRGFSRTFSVLPRTDFLSVLFCLFCFVMSSSVCLFFLSFLRPALFFCP